MKTLTFITNLVNHHQLPLADEFYKILGEGYSYIATEPLPDWLIEGGYDSSLDRPYIIRAYENKNSFNKAKFLANNSDVVIMGQASVRWIRKRLFYNKITFNFNERWFKDADFKHYLKIGIIGGILKNHFIYRYHRLYMLCASAYTAEDVHKVACYPGKKCFKWGYFTQVDDKLDLDLIFKQTYSENNISIMWCSRFIKLKHPELPIELAYKLKKAGYKFVIDMFGSGIELENSIKLVEQLGLQDVVKFKGNLPNEEILDEMKKHRIFLFTSDRNEGWGAVANEAMSNACVLVASHEIGSVPYLIQDENNGLIFKSCDVESLYEKTAYLIDHPEECQRLAQNAYYTLKNIWSPKSAAERFLNLVKILENKGCNFYKNGPCSLA